MQKERLTIDNNNMSFRANIENSPSIIKAYFSNNRFEFAKKETFANLLEVKADSIFLNQVHLLNHLENDNKYNKILFIEEENDYPIQMTYAGYGVFLPYLDKWVDYYSMVLIRAIYENFNKDIKFIFNFKNILGVIVKETNIKAHIYDDYISELYNRFSKLAKELKFNVEIKRDKSNILVNCINKLPKEYEIINYIIDIGINFKSPCMNLKPNDMDNYESIIYQIIKNKIDTTKTLNQNMLVTIKSDLPEFVIDYIVDKTIDKYKRVNYGELTKGDRVGQIQITQDLSNEFTLTNEVKL